MKRILVVEDERNILDNVMETLELEGFQVAGAQDGLSGINLAREFRPDLIVCDIMMGEISGYDVLMSVRADSTLCNTPFIFLTALNTRADQRMGMDRGADDYLTKPFSPTELLSAVATRLEKHHRIMDEQDEKISRIRDHITYALPHELRTPLTGLIGTADMLKFEDLDKETIHTLADVMDRSLNRLQHVIENYLLYAQLELIATNQDQLSQFQAECLDYPESVITETALEISQCAEREQDLKLNLQNIPVRVSPNDLAKMTFELVDNAFKFSKSGTDVVVHSYEENGDYCVVVEDNGRGMATSEIEAIGAYIQFNRRLFEQQGMGLGLAICQRMVQLYGGHLVISSTEGLGTQVTISIPKHTQ